MDGIVVLISGTGSNLKAICNEGLMHDIKCVISNKNDALGLQFAKDKGLATHVLNHKDFTSREKYDKALATVIDSYSPQLIILAGFMRILTKWFVENYINRILNIHPSLLPSFPGANAIEEALSAKVKLTGVTIHLVTEGIDQGPILAQGTVPIFLSDSLQNLADRIHKLEHILYPFVIKKLLTNKSQISNGYLNIIQEDTDQISLMQPDCNIFY